MRVFGPSNQNNKLKDAKKHSVVVRGTAEVADKSLWVYL